MFTKKIRLLIACIACLASTSLSESFANPFDKIDTKVKDGQLAAYTEIYIAPVITDLDQGRPNTSPRLRRNADPYVPKDDQAEKAADLHSVLTAALGRQKTIVNAPAPGVLTITPKLVSLVPSRLTLSARASRLGQDVNRTFIAGGAAFEVMLSDDGNLLATLEDEYTTTLNDGAPRIGYWQDADDAFSFFSGKLAKYVSNN